MPKPASDPVIRFALEARVLCLDLIQDVLLAVPEPSRRSLLRWLADDIAAADKGPDEAGEVRVFWENLMELDPRDRESRRTA